MPLTAAQINQIKKIIEKHTNVLMQIIVGDGEVSPQALKKLGLPKSITNLITDSYKYGKLGVLAGKSIAKMAPKDADALIKKLNLTTRQQKSVEYLKAKTQLSINSLTQKISTAVLSTVLQDQLNMYQSIQKVIPKAMEDGLDRYKVIQQLREVSGDWERDWHRVAHTEMWDAKVQGEANAIIDNESPISKKGKETLVFKRPAPNACLQCKKLYLDKDGITPKLFKITDLQANGTNYGKKQADWKATIGVLHPNCMCPLSVMPDGYKFDNSGQLVPDTK